MNQDSQTLKLLNICGLIEANCEYLTVINRCVTSQDRQSMDNLPTLESYLTDISSQATKKAKLELPELSQLIIQLAYLCYACRCQNMLLVAQSEQFRVQERQVRDETRFQILLFYKVADITQPNHPYLLKDCIDFICLQYRRYLALDTCNLAASSDHKVIQTFLKQYEYLHNNFHCFEHNPNSFYRCLQETSLFREHSLLRSIQRDSILHLIKSSKAYSAAFVKFLQEDFQLVSCYYNLKIKKTEKSKLTKKLQEISSNVIAFLQTLEGDSASQFPAHPEEPHQKVKIQVKNAVRPEKDFYSAVGEILPALPKGTEERIEKPPAAASFWEYLVDYHPDSSILILQLISSAMVIGFDTMDFIAFQSNMFTLSSAFVSINLREWSVAGGISKKCVEFKSVSPLKNEDSLLERILLLRDIVMISAKIYEPQLKRKECAVQLMEDQSRLVQISRKVDHYTRLYLKVANDAYQGLRDARSEQ